jgi:cell division protein FtsL
MTAVAQAWRSGATQGRPEESEQEWQQPTARHAPQARVSTAQRARRSRLTRAFIVFVVCLTVLAVGRVAMSFAVVQKSLATDAVMREQRSVTAENAQLAEDVAQLASTVRIRHIAETQLGLVDADHVLYLKVLKNRVPRSQAVLRVAARP